MVNASAAVLEAMHVVEEFGAICEAMYLIMVSDGKVSNVERDVLRGALRIISDDQVRSSHIESMVDQAARRIAESGFEARLDSVVERLRGDRVKSELTLLLAAAVAAADDQIVPQEQAVIDALAEGLGITEVEANASLDEMNHKESGKFPIARR